MNNKNIWVTYPWHCVNMLAFMWNGDEKIECTRIAEKVCRVSNVSKCRLLSWVDPCSLEW